MSKAAFNRGYKKATNNKAMYRQEGGDVFGVGEGGEGAGTPTTAPSSPYDAGQNLPGEAPVFATEYQGQEWAFAPNAAAPKDMLEFVKEGGTPADIKPGDLIHSKDTYLYVKGDPSWSTDQVNITSSWYRSVEPAGPAPKSTPS